LLNFIFPFIEQGDMEFGSADPMTPKRGILQQHGTQVAVLNIGIYLIDRMASADYEPFAREQI
jgi:hypothetical protein